MNQVMVLSLIAILVTVGVYGLVGLIVKLDDIGFWLEKIQRHCPRYRQKPAGAGAVADEKFVDSGNSGDVLVGGGIIVHGVASLHHAIEHLASGHGSVIAAILPTLLNLVLGFIVGVIVVAVVKLVEKYAENRINFC